MHKACKGLWIGVSILLIVLSTYIYTCAIAASVVWNKYPAMFSQVQYCRFSDLTRTKISSDSALCVITGRMDFFQFNVVFPNASLECTCNMCPHTNQDYPECFIDVDGPILNTIIYHYKGPVTTSSPQLIFVLYLIGAVLFGMAIIQIVLITCEDRINACKDRNRPKNKGYHPIATVV